MSAGTSARLLVIDADSDYRAVIARRVELGAAEPWGSEWHSPEQLRGYVARLRRKLKSVHIPYELVSQQGRGYCLRWLHSGNSAPR